MKKKIVSILGMMLLATACQQETKPESKSQEMNSDMQKGDKKDSNGRNSTREQMKKRSPAPKNNKSCGPKCDSGCGNSCGPCCENTEAMLEEAQEITADPEAQI